MSPAVEAIRRGDASSRGTGFLIGIDVGGTFTDVVVADRRGGTSVHKAFTRPADEAEGVFDALERAARAKDLTLEALLGDTHRLIHGSTVAANALIEKKGANTAFVTTRGFRDTLVMRRMFRENMYDLRAAVPENIIAREAIVEVGGRLDRDGNEVEPMTGADVDAVVARLGELGIESVGISLLFAFRNPASEARLRDEIAGRMPGVYVAASSDIVPEIRDYERASTTLLCAYLGPKASVYLRALEQRLLEHGLACGVQVMRSDGGVCSVEEAVRRPTDLLLSGPAGGVVAAMASEELADEPNLISFDMGGTSCDISAVREGRAVSSTFLPRHSRFEGWDVLTPFLNIHTLGSGGGSIVWTDRGGGLHVGPRSAGSTPGPACYGNGGVEPTVTDANVLLGYLNPDNFLGREFTLDREAAVAALHRVADPLGYTPEALAIGVFDIVNAAMADRIRVILADRGDDPHDFTLLCYGGAGGTHAAAIMKELGIRRVIVPRDAAGFSAAGFLHSNEQKDFVRTVARALTATDAAEIAAAFEAMRNAAGTEAAEDGWSYRYQADMRYQGQTHDIRISLPDGSGDPENIRARFERAYEDVFGYLSDPSLIMLMNLRLIATRTTEKPWPTSVMADAAAAAPRGERAAYFSELTGWAAAPVYDGGRLAARQGCAGPAIVELPATTIVVRPGQRLVTDHYGNFVIDSLED
ncbi:MAG: hydantoinase/oxoprolinase family protein [Solirubrobacteraceae bacterium]